MKRATLVLQRARVLYEVPELQMDCSFDADLRDIAVIKGNVCEGRYTYENEACDGEEKGAKVGFLSWLGYGNMKRSEGCALEFSLISWRLESGIWQTRSYDDFAQ